MLDTNPLRQLSALGQSIWLDDIHRNLIQSDTLHRLIREDSLKGMTSNPAIFEKAISESQEYDESIHKLALAGNNAKSIYEQISQHDVRHTADVFLPIYKQTDALDGYVSLEVNPHLAYDTGLTIEEGRRLWAALDRSNVFIKVPATKEGLPAIEQLIRDGINVNVTLLFGLPRYREAALAYISGLELRMKDGNPIKQVVSVASFFLSRIDTMVDPLLGTIISQGGSQAVIAAQLQGQAAIASAKVAYQIFKETFQHERFQKLAAKGARPQRLLWASTGSKNPHYPDVKYVESLIGPDTITTLPLETLNAYRDHGKAHSTLEENMDQAPWVLRQLQALGIHLDHITKELESQGVVKFNQPFDALINALANKATANKS